VETTMVAGRRPSVPVSVAIDLTDRASFLAEGKRRGLGLSPTIRTLAKERLTALDDARQRERALAWQTARAVRIWERFAAGTEREVPKTEIDAIFDQASRRTERPQRRGR